MRWKRHCDSWPAVPQTLRCDSNFERDFHVPLHHNFFEPHCKLKFCFKVMKSFRLTLILQLTIIFGLYGIIVEIFRPSTYSTAVSTTNFTSMINAWFLMTTVVYFGSSLTSEASRTVTVFSKFMAISNFYYTQKQDLIFLLSQLRSRKVEVRNFLFIVSWNVIVAVSFDWLLGSICLKLVSFKGHVNRCNILDHHLPVWVFKIMQMVSYLVFEYF